MHQTVEQALADHSVNFSQNAHGSRTSRMNCRTRKPMSASWPKDFLMWPSLSDGLQIEVRV